MEIRIQWFLMIGADIPVDPEIDLENTTTAELAGDDAYHFFQEDVTDKLQVIKEDNPDANLIIDFYGLYAVADRQIVEVTDDWHRYFESHPFLRERLVEESRKFKYGEFEHPLIGTALPAIVMVERDLPVDPNSLKVPNPAERYRVEESRPLFDVVDADTLHVTIRELGEMTGMPLELRGAFGIMFEA